MFFPKWRLSIKGLIWSFSLSVLLLEEQAQPTLKPTLGLFLGEPLSAGATQSLPPPSPCGWGLPGAAPPPHQAMRAQGVWGSQRACPRPG